MCNESYVERVSIVSPFHRFPRSAADPYNGIFRRDGEAFRNRLKVELTTSACAGTPFEVKYLEHVQLAVSLGFPRRGDLQIILISPAGKLRFAVSTGSWKTNSTARQQFSKHFSGTKAKLLDPRPFDAYPFGIRFWIFDSVMTWGESPRGKWTVHIISKVIDAIRKL